MSDKKIILTTCGNKDEAQDIAWALVERKLAACVNVVAIESVFRWKNEVEGANEFLLVIKTTAAAFDRIAQTIKQMNTYELPECVQIGIETGNEAYLNWIQESVE